MITNGRGFRDLKIWQRGLEIVVKVYKLTNKFPQTERFGLTDQLRRAVNSIIANIAEAHGRYYYADKSRVLFQSRGECEEARSHLSVAAALNYISKEEFDDLDSQLAGLGMGINAYIDSLRREK